MEDIRIGEDDLSLEQTPVVLGSDPFELPNGYLLIRRPGEDSWAKWKKNEHGRLEFAGNGITAPDGDYIRAASSDSRYLIVAMNRSSKVQVFDLEKKRYLNDTPQGDYVIFGPGCAVYQRLNHLAFYWLETETVTFKIMGSAQSRLYDMSYNGASLVFLWMQEERTYKIVMVDITDAKNITLTTIHETQQNVFRFSGFLFPTPSTVVFGLEWRIYVFDTISMTFIVNREDANGSKEHFAISPDGRVMFHRRTGAMPAHDLLIMPINASDDLMEFLDEVTDANIGRLVGPRVDYRPEKPLIVITDIELISMAHRIRKMTKDWKRLMFADGYNGMRSTIVFEHPFPHIVFEQAKPDRTWIRILSNFTLDTHITWPGPGLSLRRETIDTIRSLGFAIDQITAAVGVIYANSGMTFEEAKKDYAMGLVRALAKNIIAK